MADALVILVLGTVIGAASRFFSLSTPAKAMLAGRGDLYPHSSGPTHITAQLPEGSTEVTWGGLMTRSQQEPIPSNWREPLDAWAAWMRAKGDRPQTIALRTRHIRALSRALQNSPELVTNDDLVGYFGSKNWAPSTRKSHRSSAVSFFAHLWRHEPIRDPAVQMPTITVPPSTPRPAPVHVIKAALAGAGERERLMVRLMAEAGLRIGEVVLVSLQDLLPDLIGHSLVVRGKGGKERVVLLQDELARDLIAYGRKVGGHFVFPGLDNGHLSPNWASKLVGRFLGPEWTSHTLRHRFGTSAYEGTRDIRAVADAMGHSSTVTTQTYVRPSITSASSVSGAAALYPAAAPSDSIRLASGIRLTLERNLLHITTSSEGHKMALTHDDINNLARLFVKRANQQ